ncbi:FAD-dependent oxidoreductase [Aureimonas pseudogalii]|uniref:Glycine oxidase n=1 Tax=Aureimonas pseudogalii TaxID=1744844 RepID=A0A7W6H3I6_9HYPH|nr:FAD-dependent oxidoreductase [Aureimonas pseudogalii]MBB3998101.1 glycine oxidase [Aureimonas pseudogalii]
MTIHVLGAGVAGLTTAFRLARAGREVVVHEAASALGGQAASWLAGGMLAPHCEAATADPSIVAPGLEGIAFWKEATDVEACGTLVLAGARDAGDLRQFAARTSGHETLDADAIAALEPDLAGRFRAGLFYRDECHLDPRRAMQSLARGIREAGGTILYASVAEAETFAGETVVDCRGLRSNAGDLRAVRGEMVLLRSREVALSRPVRLLHPRSPIYVVPREDGIFMVGATMIESDRSGPITLRSAVELLSAAYALHPAFAEAEVVETGAACRPAFPDNLPRVERQGRVVTFTGLFRHGFLLSPAFSAEAAAIAAEIEDAS